MNYRTHFFLVTVFLVASCSIFFGQARNQFAAYHLTVRIDPATSRLQCRADIRNSNDSSFILNNDLEIQHLLVDGKSAPFQRKVSTFMPNSSEIVIADPSHKSIVIEYSGEIKADSFPPIVRAVNMINADLVELAMYVTWYPRQKSGAFFNFQMDVDMPSPYVTVTNGRLKGEKREDNRHQTSW